MVPYAPVSSGPGTVEPWPTSPVRSTSRLRSSRYLTRLPTRVTSRRSTQPWLGVELLTPLPIGLGTRFRARMGRAGTEMLVELTAFDRPHRLGSRTTSSMMETSGALTFAAEGEGTVMGWDWQVHPKGWMRILSPLVGPLGGRMERRIWTELKHQLENNGPRSA